MVCVNARLLQKFDVLSNWSASNPILLNGELAVVSAQNQIRFKIGDGTTPFTQLSYIDQIQISTDNVYADDVYTNSIAVGHNASATSQAAAVGTNVSALAQQSMAVGFNAKTLSTSPGSFVYNGIEDPLLPVYTDQGPGTFCINPALGISGMYIGISSLAELLSQKGNVVSGTTAQWSADNTFAPEEGQIVIWTDKTTLVKEVQDGPDLSVKIPGIKIGDGNTYNLDLPFVGDEIIAQLVTDAERASWNHKITVGDISNPNDDGVIGETLIITRN